MLNPARVGTSQPVGRGLVCAAGLLLVATACVPSDPATPVAVRQDGGQTAIVAPLCPDEQVRAVYLTAGVEGDQTLWRIEALSGADRSEFVVGDVPEGFVEVTPLNPSWRFGENTVFVDTWDGIQLLGTFDVSGLTDGVLTSDLRPTTLDDLVDERHCG